MSAERVSQGLGHFPMLINGVWTTNDAPPLVVFDPATEEEIATVPIVNDEQLAEAISATVAAAHRWGAVSGWERSKILREISGRIKEQSEHLAEVLTSEQGKSIAEARAEVIQSAEYFDWFADEARRIYGRVVESRANDRKQVVVHEPVGATGIFTPNNFPMVLPARKIAAALAAGCAVIIKPAEDTPLSVLLLARVCQEAGLPDGVLNVVTGDPAHIVGTIVAAPGIRKISLTGSVEVGRLVMRQAAETVKRMSMELGGNAPVVVLSDADPILAARAAVASKFRNGGQVCVSPSRFFVHQDVHDAFVGELVEGTRRLTIGPGLQEATVVGPLVSGRRLDAVSGMVEDAREKGATVLVGGERVPGQQRGHFYLPTILTDVTPDMECLTQEPFGPILPVVAFTDIDDAITQANSVAVGLAGYVFGGDIVAAERVARRLEVGMVGINTMALTSPETPFGGVKESGFGSEGGLEGILEYLQPKYLNSPC